MKRKSTFNSTTEQHRHQIWKFAQIHRVSSKIGYPSNNNNYNTCPCCDQILQKKPISIGEHTKQLEIFGFGYPLWFSFIKYCIILLMVLIVSKTATQLYMATKENYQFCYGNHAKTLGNHAISPSTVDHRAYFNSEDHQNFVHTRSDHNLRHLISDQNFFNSHKNEQLQFATQQKPSHKSHQLHCTSWMVYFSIFKGEQMSRNVFLRIVAFLIHLVALIGIRNMMIKQYKYLDQRNTTISDYSLLVSNLPSKYNLKSSLKKLFQKQFNKKYGQQIISMIYIFQQDAITHPQQEIQQIHKKMLQHKQNQNKEQEQKAHDQILQKEETIQRQSKRIRNQINNDYIKSDKMIIVMSKEEHKDDVLQIVQEGKKNYLDYFDTDFNNHQKQITFKQAPQPNEIIWEHIDESDTKRTRLIIRGWIFTIIFLAFVTVVFYFILLTKTNLFVQAVQMQQSGLHIQEAKAAKSFATIIVFCAIFGVVLFNKFIMNQVLHKFVHMQRHAYTVQQSNSFAVKYALGMFFTTALMTLAVEAITFKNFYSHSFGVIQQETIMFFITAFFVPLVWIVHPFSLYKKFQLWRSKGKLLTQKEANELIEEFPYDLGKRHAEIFQIMWFTFLYSGLIPLGSFLSLIGLVIYYWVDKYNFLRRSALKQGLSGKMSLHAIKSLDATLFLAPAGQLLFNYCIRNQFNYIDFIMTILGIVYLLLPVSDIIWKLNYENFFKQQKTYNQSKGKFKETYYSLHPMYKHTHKKQIQQHYKYVMEYQNNKKQK